MKLRPIAILFSMLALGACDSANSTSGISLADEKIAAPIKHVTLSKTKVAIASSADAAIEYAMELGSNNDKVNYLISQGKSFYNSENFQASVDVAQFILLNLDKDSPAAKNLLNDAKEKLASMAGDMAQDKVNDAMGSFGF